MCNCGRTATATTWTVTYPAGSGLTATSHTTEAAALIAAAKVPGAEVIPVTSAPATH